jgi:hypothetical protein
VLQIILGSWLGRWSAQGNRHEITAQVQSLPSFSARQSRNISRKSMNVGSSHFIFLVLDIVVKATMLNSGIRSSSCSSVSFSIKKRYS